jgi:hypothetical protein
VVVIDARSAVRGSRATSCADTRRVRSLTGAALAALLLAGSARADEWEAWPEANLFRRLGPTTRLYFVSAYATGGKEAQSRTLDVAGYFDLVLKPVLLPFLQEEWQRKKYLWVRIGYDHVFKGEGGALATPEDRGIVALHARAYLPAELLFEGRARADLRWIGGDYSTRYRLRIEVNREFNVRDRAVTPYLQAETVYDTRYDGWSRRLYQVGVEVQLTEHFRLEPYLARQLDTLPADAGLYALGLVARWYY